MTGPVIVCGMGSVGYRIVQLLRRLGEAVVVVTRDSRDERLRAVEADGVRVLRGDARDEDLLRTAGIDRAAALIAATDQDPANIEMALDAKRLGPDLPVVIRLFDQHLAAHLEAAFEIRRALGVSALAAPSFAAAALGERWIGAFSVGGADYVIGRVRLDAGMEASDLTGRYGLLPIAVEEAEPAPRATVVGLRSAWERWVWGPEGRPESPARRRDWLAWLDFARRVWRHAPPPLRSAFVLLNALIALSVVVFRYALGLSLVDALYYIITTVTTVGYGDITPREAGPWVKLYACLVMLLGSAGIAMLYSIITDFVVTARFRQLLGRERIPEHGHVVVAGLGNLGYRVVQELERAGAPVVAIERKAEGEFVEAVRARSPVVVGDARLADTLARAGVARAHAVVAAINDDAADLGIVLAARALNARLRVVARVSDADFARKVQAALHVDAALSPGLMAAPTFVAAALYPGVLAAFVQGERLLVVLRRARSGDWEGLAPSELSAQGVQVLLRRPAGAGEPRLAGDNGPLTGDEEVVAVVSRALR